MLVPFPFLQRLMPDGSCCSVGFVILSAFLLLIGDGGSGGGRTGFTGMRTRNACETFDLHRQAGSVGQFSGPFLSSVR